MSKVLVLIFVFLLFSPAINYGQGRDSISILRAEFSENKGQWPKQVHFKASLSDGNIWFENKAIRFDLYDPQEMEATSHHRQANNGKVSIADKVKRHVYKLQFINTLEANIKGINPIFQTENYFLGNDKSKWASGVKKYQKIVYQELYHGIDAIIYEDDQRLKWDFVVQAQSDPNQILIAYQGVDKISIKKGNLIIETSVNQIIELAPIAYQINEKGQRIDVACQYSLTDNQVKFIFPKSYDKSRTLIIDPTLVFASYSGSIADNWGFTATYDSKGYLYAGGIVFSTGYPTTLGAFDTIFNGIFDVSISKFDTNGTQLIYSTYLGGADGEVPTSLIVNSKDELIVMGATSSTNFPTTSLAYDNSFNGGTSTNISSSLLFSNGSDLFISHFNRNGTQLLGSTFLGGTANDGINSSSILTNNYGDDIRGEVMVDNNDNIYIVSISQSANFPTTSGVFQPLKGLLNEGVIAKFDDLLQQLIWSSYFGGQGDDAIFGIKVSHNQDIYITGGTTSNNLNTSATAYQTTYQGGNADGFVARISGNGQQIIACSYIGSIAFDQSYLIDLDRYDNVYLFGQTKDTTSSFIFNALWNSPNDGQFITKLSRGLNNRVWSTTWGNGAPGIDVVPSAFMVDLCNRVYLSAWGGNVNAGSAFAGGNTINLPWTANAIQTNTDGSDYYLMVMADDASALDYGSFYGGNLSAEHVDGGTSRFDNKGRIYQNVCAGCGGHDDFPTTTNCYSSINNSVNCNNGVFKIDFNIPAIVADFVDPPVVCLPDSSVFQNISFLSHPSSTQYQWDFGDGQFSFQKSPKHRYSTNGVYTVQLSIYDPLSCNLRDTILKQVVVLSGLIDSLPQKTTCFGEPVQIGILPVSDTSIHFLWTPNTSLTNATISNPIANPITSTTYTMQMTNGFCNDLYTQEVEVLDLVANAGSDTTACANTILLHGRSNTPLVNYHWSSNPYFTDTLNNYPTDADLLYVYSQPTFLYFKISRDNCSDSDSLFLNREIILTTGTVNDPKCYNDSNGSIAIIAQGGSIPYSYNWSNGQIGHTASNLHAGNYSVTISDINGCFSTFDTILQQPSKLITNKRNENIPCALACIGRAWANPQGGTLPYHWQWNDPNSQQTNPAIQLCDGVYTVIVTDANLCETTDTIEILDSSLYINFTAWADFDNIYEGERAFLHATLLGPAYHYQWTPSLGLSDANSPNPVASPKSTTTYEVLATDQYGCWYSDSITIYITDVICEEPYIYVPNAFTPNEDGQNDLLFVKSSVGWDLQFMIYDRWGELVFETEDINRGWDGKFNGKKLQAGVYVYHLKLTCLNHETFIKKGNITLIR